MTAVASDIPMAPDRGDPAPVVFARTVDEDRAAVAVGDLLDALHGARTITSALHGRLREDPAARREFLDLARTGK